MKFYRYAMAMAVAAGVTFSGLKVAHGELVYEDDLNTSAVQSSSVAPQQPAQPIQIITEQPREQEREALSKSEMMRRQRLREELKNEDLLTQKLEELRLRDEVQRTDQILGSGVKKEVQPELVEERVGAAQVAPAPAPAQAGVVPAAPMDPSVSGAPVPVMTADMPADEESDELQGRVSLTPRGGTSSIVDSIYDVEAKYAFGLGLSVDVTDYISFTAGYTYATYSLGAGTTLTSGFGYPMTSLQKIELKDNVIDIGARAHVLGNRSKVRPFLGAGLAYRKGYVNYDERTRNFIKQYNPYGAADVDVSGFAGYLEAGLEFKLTKSIAISGMFRYFNILSSRQTNRVDPNAFYNGGLTPVYSPLNSYGAYGPYSYTNGTREAAGDALSKNNFYQLMAGVTISF